ncbi:MAG: FkbM family methyltransferase [Defluviitaleaceae bacterium]|nr:FkbM family methyltransferase [Defluviitaleaceae bacterium]
MGIIGNLANKYLSPEIAIPLRILNAKRLGSLERELKILKYFIPNKNLTVIDVGANTGLYTYFMRLYSNNVHSFEPNPDLANHLSKMKNITIHNCALSDESKSMKFYIPANGEATALASLIPLYDNNKEITIPARTLDSFLLENVALIKIDVEGNEYLTIRGSEQTIKKYKPALIVEINDGMFQKNPACSTMEFHDIIGYICSLGYFCFYLYDDKFHSIDSLGSFENKHDLINNFIFSSDDLSDIL